MSGVPSDAVPAVLAHGATDVEVAVVSMSARARDGEDAAYLEWHGLDHLPEQYRISGVRLGSRWVSTAACREARVGGTDRFAAVDHVVQYLFAGPVQPALATFFQLGADLRAVGRLPVRLPSVELGGYRLTDRLASPGALVGADVLPWRPARGVYLLIEASPTALDALVAVPGVAGVWRYSGAADLHPGLAATSGLYLSVCYVDDDPVAVAGRLAPLLAGGAPLLAAPLVTVVPWEWSRSLP